MPGSGKQSGGGGRGQGPRRSGPGGPKRPTGGFKRGKGAMPGGRGGKKPAGGRPAPMGTASATAPAPSARQMRARDVVIRRIAEDLRQRPRFDLRPLQIGTMSQRDAVLARSIHHEVIRRLDTLEAVLVSQIDRPWEQLEENLRAALLVGAAQILFFDRVPDHAAVDESVEWAKRKIRTGAGGLVNAVLRRVIELRGEVVENANWRTEAVLPLSDGRFLRLTRDVFPETDDARLAVMTSHPLWAIGRWSRQYSPVSAEEIALHSLVHAPTILAAREGSSSALPTGCRPHSMDGFAVYEGASDELGAILEAAPEWRVQDPGSARSLRAAAGHLGSPKLIVDLCAGSGTKTSQLLALFPDARLVASDQDQRRFALLRVRFASEDRVQVLESSELYELAGSADAVLIDVPCSNSGTLARRVEAKYRLDESHLDSLVKLQRQIAIDALRLRRPQGFIVYATCSLEHEENEAQNAWMSRWNQTRTIASGGVLPASKPGDGPEAYHDGGYFAVWQ